MYIRSGMYVVALESLTKDLDVGITEQDVTRAAIRALNDALDFGRTRAAREMRRQVNFPSSYLQGSEKGRLRVTQRAHPGDLEGHITGRHDPTSLARFAKTSGKAGGGVHVTVKPGRSKLIKSAFLMKLRSGNDGALGNMGLAVRTKDGKPPRGAYVPKRLSENLWLLYGPSVDQVFRTVRDDLPGPVEDRFENEFHRLISQVQR